MKKKLEIASNITLGDKYCDTNESSLKLAAAYNTSFLQSLLIGKTEIPVMLD